MFFSHINMFTNMLVVDVLYERVLQTQQCPGSKISFMVSERRGVIGHFSVA